MQDGRLDVETGGSGEPLLLVHGGVERGLTWRAQAELAARWRLLVPARRGFPPSPPADRQDFDADARDLGALLDDEPAHCVGFSYGGVGLALAAAADPRRVLSLTLVEPPLLAAAADRPPVRELLELAAAAGSGDGAAAERVAATFPALATVAFPGDPEFERAFYAARAAAPPPRPPWDAEPDLAAVAAAGVPALVVSGGHSPVMDAVCDALAERLDAERAELPGRAHAIPHAPGFNELLERFLRSV